MDEHIVDSNFFVKESHILKESKGQFNLKL